jgi:hypothetical protein
VTYGPSESAAGPPLPHRQAAAAPLAEPAPESPTGPIALYDDQSYCTAPLAEPAPESRWRLVIGPVIGDWPNRHRRALAGPWRSPRPKAPQGQSPVAIAGPSKPSPAWHSGASLPVSERSRVTGTVVSRTCDRDNRRPLRLLLPQSPASFLSPRRGPACRPPATQVHRPTRNGEPNTQPPSPARPRRRRRSRARSVGFDGREAAPSAPLDTEALADGSSPVHPLLPAHQCFQCFLTACFASRLREAAPAQAPR